VSQTLIVCESTSTSSGNIRDTGASAGGDQGLPLIGWVDQRGITTEPSTSQIELPGLDIGL
jgi:hypothetical protein